MRPLAALIVLALAPLLPAAEIERLWTTWRDAAYFDSISEHFSGEEKTGSEVVVRTRADQRAGYYFLVRLGFGESGAPALKAVLDILKPGDTAPTTHTFDLPPTPRSSQVYQLGVTGGDWPGKSAQPPAWRIRFLDTNGAEVAARSSFLWEAPKR